MLPKTMSPEIDELGQNLTQEDEGRGGREGGKGERE